MIAAQEPRDGHCGRPGASGEILFQPPERGHVLSHQPGVEFDFWFVGSHREPRIEPLAPVVNNKNTRRPTKGAVRPLPSGYMPESRPVFHPEIGKFFSDLREAKGWTQRQAEDIAERRKLSALTRQVLWRLEKGKTKNIEPTVLRAIADLYEMPYGDLVQRWTLHRYGVDLSRHNQPGEIDQADSEPSGQPIGWSELNNRAVSRGNLDGTQPAERPASLRRTAHAPTESLDPRSSSAGEVIDRLFGLAHDFHEHADELQRLADALLSGPPNAETPASRRGPPTIDSDFRVHGGSATRTPQRKRKTG